MYHSWGSHNAWLRQITNRNYLYISEYIAQNGNLNDDDWIWVESAYNKIKVQCRIMKVLISLLYGLGDAIGKRKGAWNLDPNSPKTKKLSNKSYYS